MSEQVNKPDELVQVPKDELVREDIEKALDEYEHQIGLPTFKKIDPPEYLTMSLEDMRKKGPDELSEAIFLISQYAMYIQRVINRDRSWERWTKSKVDEIAASYLPQMGTGYGYNERELMAKHNPEICKRLNAFLRKVRMQIDRLWDVPMHLKMISDSIKEIKYVQLRQERNNGN